MTAISDIRDRLLAIDTNIDNPDYEKGKLDKNGKPVPEYLTMDNFGSFLACKKGLPSIDKLQELADEYGDEFKPNLLREKYHLDFSFDESFFNEESPFNNNFMFVGLNAAARGEDKKNKKGELTKGDSLSNWKNFHDKKNFANTCKMYVQLSESESEPIFKGCYITDLLKNKVDSNSNHISRDFFLLSNEDISFANKNADENERLKKYNEWYGSDDDNDMSKLIKSNEDVFKNSVDIFIQECDVIQPKNLVIFGGTAYKALKRFAQTDAVKEYDKDHKNKISDLFKNAIWLEHYANTRSLLSYFKDRPVEHIPDYTPRFEVAKNNL